MKTLLTLIEAKLAREARSGRSDAEGQQTRSPQTQERLAWEFEVEGDLDHLLRGAPLTREAWIDGTDEALMGFHVAWDTRTSETLAHELRVGLGVADKIEVSARGEARQDRYEVVQQRAKAVLSELRGQPDGLRYFGAFTFDASDPRAADGDEMATRFVLPTWSLTQVASNLVRATLCATRTELASPAILAQAARIESYFERGMKAAVSLHAAPHASDELTTQGAGRDSFLRAGEAAIQALARAELTKVVLARRIELSAPQPAALVLQRLSQTQACTRFSLGTGAGAYLGASPEMLVSRDELGARTEAVAGTRSAQHLEDGATAAAQDASTQDLLAHEKDRHEQQVVIDAIREVIARAGCTSTEAATPRVRVLRNVQHLVTEIQIVGKKHHVLDWVKHLHPTPALGGTPTDAALAFLRAHEPAPRGYYGAPLGWFDRDGNGAFVVGIRAALHRGDRAELWSGAGFVVGSVAASEFEETELKARTMLRAFSHHVSGPSAADMSKSSGKPTLNATRPAPQPPPSQQEVLGRP
jgi:menaquinone-specific isochorismate synthase